MFSYPERSIRRYTLPLAAVLGLALGWLMPGNSRLEDALNKAFVQPLNPRIMIVGIDDASLRDYGRLDSWPRDLYARALTTLQDAGAQAIGLDVVLSDPERQDDTLNSAFSHPNVVLATLPEDSQNHHPHWTSPTGVSALNAPRGLGVSEVQTAYPAQQGPGQPDTQTPPLVPSFARQVAEAAGQPLPLSTVPWLMSYSPPEPILERTLSFRDVVNGSIRYSDIQNKIVLVGLTAGGLGGTVADITGRPVPGVILQARAVDTFLREPYTRLPTWLTMLLCLLFACAVVLLRQLWGFVLALLALSLALPLWQAHIIFPGVTVSLAAMLGVGLVAFERWWQLRQRGTRDPLTGFGNRLAFTRAVEHRWATRESRPISLLLLDINDFRQVNERYGRLAGDDVLRDLAQRLQRLKRRGDVLFRWGPDEFAVLLDQTTADQLPGVVGRYQRELQPLRFRDLNLLTNMGAAATSQDIATPTALIEAASRNRYRMKYQRDQHRAKAGEPEPAAPKPPTLRPNRRKQDKH